MDVNRPQNPSRVRRVRNMTVLTGARGNLRRNSSYRALLVMTTGPCDSATQRPGYVGIVSRW
ncbi:ORFL52C [Human betaherpesvirus 5]|nr:ORFL52C [Human betaherpesvirus 5]QHX40352.1 ORFL52C [Human betaherpesvirus 5]